MKCPICDSSLDGTEEAVSLHVNNCLDRQSTPSKTTATIQTSIQNFFFSREIVQKDIISTTTPKATDANIKEPLVKDHSQYSPTPLPRLSKTFPGELAHKRLLGLPNVAVDAFADGKLEGVKYYFLTHFHSDHYRGLDAGFDWGVLVCSEVTANLIVSVLKVNESHILRVPLEVWTGLGDFSLLFVDAFHCPGSVMAVFRRHDGRYLLHTGDFRASSSLIGNPIWKTLDGHFEAIYLDTTYANPQYQFPSQDCVMDSCCKLVERLIQKSDQRLFSPIKRLVLVGSYLIGKEKVALAIANTLQSSIYCHPRKRNIIKCMQWPDLIKRLTDNPEEAQVHLVSMSDLDAESIGTMLNCLWPHFSHALAIKPTGWAFNPRQPTNNASSSTTNSLTFTDHLRRDSNGQIVKRRDAIAIYSVPYSEHSSFDELCDFLATPWFSSDWVIPTVDNPEDCYLQTADYSSSRALLQTWHSSIAQNRRRPS